MFYRSYIVKNHNGIYYFRFIIPKAFQCLFPNNRREIRRTLKTRTKSIALTKARKYKVYMDEYLNQLDVLDNSIDELEEGYKLLSHLDNLNELSKKPPFLTTELDEFISRLSEYQKSLIEKSQDSFYQLKKQNTDTPTPTPTKIAQEPSSTIKQTSVLPLIEMFIKEKGDIRRRTVDSYKEHLNTFVEIMDINNVENIDIDKVRHFKSSIQNLPPNRKKVKIYRDKTIKEILSKVNKKTISNQTIKLYFDTVKSFLKWIVDNKYISDDLGSILKISRNKKQKNKFRAIFSLDDLNKMFSIDDYQQLNGFRTKPFRYWVPLIGLYSGARLNEICQLKISDIRQEKRIWYFDMNTEKDNQIKTEAGKRKVPIHKTLIKLGFIKYYESVIKGRQLFPQLKPDKYGSYRKNVSTFFNSDYRGKEGLLGYVGIEKETPEGKKNFHSFRHTFVNQGKQIQLKDQILREIIGHSGNDETFDRYGKEFYIETKKTEINKITFDCKLPRPW